MSKSKSRSMKLVREPRVDFTPLRNLKEVGEKPEKNYQIIVIGYPYESPDGFTCPGSRNAIQAIRDHPLWTEEHLFLVIPFGQSAAVKRYLKYSGTFPIVFFNTGKDFIHVGGGDDLLEFARINKEPSLSRKSARTEDTDEDDDEFI